MTLKDTQERYYKGHVKPIKTLWMTKRCFDLFLKYKSCWFQTVGRDTWQYLGHGLARKLDVLFLDPESLSGSESFMICCNTKALHWLRYCATTNHEGDDVIGELNKLLDKIGMYGYDYFIRCTGSRESADNANEKPTGISSVLKARKWLTYWIKKCFDHDSLTEFVKQHGDNDVYIPLRTRCTNTTVVEKWYGCTYADIHKAHASELMTMFDGTPLSSAVWRLIEKGLACKAAGDKDGYKETKDIVNFAVGMLHKCKRDESGRKMRGVPDTFLLGVNTFPLYNKIVKNIFMKIAKQRDIMCGNRYNKCIYAQTDGLIVQHPIAEIQDSPKIGEFGVEFKGTVLTYHCPTIKDTCTGYTIYQYTDDEGKHVKGDLPDELKQYIDLDKGIVVVYKKEIDSSTGYINNKLLSVKQEVIHENK